MVLRSLALVLLAIGLARPQKVYTKEKRHVEAVDLVICFDLSKSMEAVDFRPNRRRVAIQTLGHFIDMRKDDRIGLVLFSGEAYLATPLTLDHSLVKKAIEESSNKYLQDGTAIGQSLAVAVSHLKDSKAKSRVIVLVTDGDNNMGTVDPITAAELAKGYALKIYTIGLGKKGRVAFPVDTIDAFGRPTTAYQYLTDAVNDELLEDIATRTAGKFFRAAEDGILEKIFAEIDRLEKTRVESSTLTRYSELAWPWILGALLMLIAEGLALETRWRKIP
jgi:Ca-activated chloride channel family protein